MAGGKGAGTLSRKAAPVNISAHAQTRRPRRIAAGAAGGAQYSPD